MVQVAEMVRVLGEEPFDLTSILEPINGNAAGKDLLSMHQLGADDIHDYIEQAYAAEPYLEDDVRPGLSLLPFFTLTAIMRQNSTRTAGSIAAAMKKLGGTAELWSGMAASSEAKGESLSDSWEALAAQSDIIATRTAEDYGPAYAAFVIRRAAARGQLSRVKPVINLGDGRNEHPTQTLGDLFTIHKHFKKLEGLTIAVVGDHERYRAFHSLMIGAASLGMNVLAVESEAAPMPQRLIDLLGSRLVRPSNLDLAMQEADVLYMGRNPDEYTKKPSGNGEESEEELAEIATEATRSAELSHDYGRWVVDYDRLQQMQPGSIVLHPRPRRNELHPSVDVDARMRDVPQMENMTPMRMAIIARHLDKSITRKP